MNMRFLIAFIILIFGALGSFWITRANRSGPLDAKILAVSDSSQNRFTNLSDLPSQKSIFGTPSTNLTNEIISEYTAKILKDNQKGSGTSDSISVPNEDSLNQIIRDRFVYGISVKYFDEKDLKILQITSQYASLSYLKSILEIYKNNTDKNQDNGFIPSVAEYVNTKNSQKLHSYISSVSEQIDNLLKIATPTNWKEFHLKLINAWQKRLALGTAIIQSEDDPIKAAVAVQEIPNSIDEENNLTSLLLQNLKEL